MIWSSKKGLLLLFIPKIANIAEYFGCILMMCLKKLIVTVCASALPLVGQAQFDTQRTQYMYGPSAYCPGAVAQNDMCNVFGVYRLQWAGFEDAPHDVIVSGDIPFSISGTKHGIGVSFVSEEIGAFKNQAFLLQYAYKMPLWRGQLGLGLNLGAVNLGAVNDYKFDFTGTGNVVGSEHHEDYHKESNLDLENTSLAFDCGFGAYYSDESLYLGFSVLNLNKPSFDVGVGSGQSGQSSGSNSDSEIDIARVFYLTGGYDLPLSNEEFHLKPSALFRTDFNVNSFDLTCLVDYKKRFVGGLGYRFGDSFDFLVGANLLSGLFIGYSYDLPVSGMIKSGGSHEVCLKYSFKLEFAKKNKYKSERIL